MEAAGAANGVPAAVPSPSQAMQSLLPGGNIRFESRIAYRLLMGPLYGYASKIRCATPYFPISFEHRLAILGFIERLRAISHQCTVFADVAGILDSVLQSNAYVQLVRNTKAGTARQFGFVGSNKFYESQATRRYRNVPRPPAPSSLSTTSFILIDELVHEALHILFLAQGVRGRQAGLHSYFAEELSVTWWSDTILGSVFHDWLPRGTLLNINDDFLLDETNECPFEFWSMGFVFCGMTKSCQWLIPLVEGLQPRSLYIGERPDISQYYRDLKEVGAAQFIFRQTRRKLRMPSRLDQYP